MKKAISPEPYEVKESLLDRIGLAILMILFVGSGATIIILVALVFAKLK